MLRTLLYYPLPRLGRYLGIFIPLVVVAFVLIPFVFFYVFPLKRKAINKEENGELKLSKTNQSGLASITEEENGYKVKHAEGVQRVEMFMVYRVGILAIKRHYCLEFATDEIIIAKPKKGKLVEIYVTKVDGSVKNFRHQYSVSVASLIVMAVLQFAALFSFALAYAIGLDQSLFYRSESVWGPGRGQLFAEAIPFYVWPIILSVLIPLVFFFITLAVVKAHGPKKEVK